LQGAALNSESQTDNPVDQNGYHRLKSIEFIGGFLDGTRFDLGDGLSCLIGHRGTGKTTAIEFVRYALDEFRDNGDGGQLRKRVESLVQTNLGGGRIKLVIETKDGIEYCVSRTAVEPPIVFTAEGEPTDIALGSSSVFRADIYSQNEVETIADDPLSQLTLLDSFVADGVAQIESEIRATVGELEANGLTVIELRGALAGIADALSELPAIEEMLQKFACAGGGSAEEINRAHEQKALRDREARAVNAALEFLARYYRDFEALAGRIPEQTATFEQEMLAGPNGEALQQIVDTLRQCADRVDGALAAACQVIEQTGRSIDSAQETLGAAHQKQEAAFRELIEKHKEAEAQSAERAKLERKRNELLAQRKSRQELERKLTATREQRRQLLDRLSELRDRRFQFRKRQAERITEKLGPSIRVRVEQFGNRDEYRRLLEDAFEGARINRNVVARKIADAVSPTELSAMVLRRDRDALIDHAGINVNQAHQVLEVLGSDRVLFDLETVELIDRPRIELLDGEHYKDSLSLSTGQKCTAVLPILMLDSVNPLLIDQPEDNLDNSFIYETIVKSIRDVKTRRQLVFVTHNPNIPVLGDAERVFVLTSNGAKASIGHVGSVDECKHDVVMLLEGGEEAFRERQRRYNY
jgi:hypothetical protein